MENEFERFWMVWRLNGHSPTRKHESKASAVKEADRLALCSPGDTFFVLKAVSGARASVSPPARISIVAPTDLSELVPF